ncbi:HAD family phosphatase [Adlercreutzia sp. ZJ304]|uniref:HAD family hydrolase n=1 Tax=Adlercreutzia sp. ZJ304 TaxID=2709791 RepID=UPI001F151302|nr:HAD family phosphatase [Adlercreutzia sp. ZJ304]
MARLHSAKTMDIGVIFDCDGTLLDSMNMWHSLDDKLAQRAGVSFTKEDKDFLTSGTLLECGNYMHNKYGIGESGVDVVRIISEETARWYESEAVTKPGALDFICGLHAAGVPMAVASSTPTRLLHSGLETTGLAGFMRAIVSVEDVGSSKREPLVYDTARKALGTSQKYTWGFEDALYAVGTLSKAGYRTVGVYDSDIAGTPEELNKAADMFITSFTEITAEDFLELTLAYQ